MSLGDRVPFSLVKKVLTSRCRSPLIAPDCLRCHRTQSPRIAENNRLSNQGLRFQEWVISHQCLEHWNKAWPLFMIPVSWCTLGICHHKPVCKKSIHCTKNVLASPNTMHQNFGAKAIAPIFFNLLEHSCWIFASCLTTWPTSLLNQLYCGSIQLAPSTCCNTPRSTVQRWLSFYISIESVWKIFIHYTGCPPMLMRWTWRIAAPSLRRIALNSVHKKLFHFFVCLRKNILWSFFSYFKKFANPFWNLQTFIDLF